LYIADQDQLDAFCDRARSERIVCVDTEFLREKTLYPRLCLLQMSVSADDIACVDPFAGFDLSGVARLMTDERVTKVIHACSQDLEAIDHALGVIPGPVFDTQVAAEVATLKQENANMKAQLGSMLGTYITPQTFAPSQAVYSQITAAQAAKTTPASGS
jgi:ribonuclease D